MGDGRTKISALTGEGERVADQWDGDPDALRKLLDEGLAEADRVFVFTMRRAPDGGLKFHTHALQRKGPFTRVTWTEAYGTLMAWLDDWAGRSH